MSDSESNRPTVGWRDRMTNSEIRELVAGRFDGGPVNKREKRLYDAIETLLARQAEVLDRLPEPPDGYMSETQYARAELGADIRAILEPQERTNG